MTKASDNLFPKVILEERATDGSDTSNPAADHRALFLGEDGALHLRDSSGTVTNVGGTETLPESIIDAAGDLIIGDGADSAARLAIGTAGQVLTVNGGATAPEWATPAAGGGTHSYLGYNTVGGSNLNATVNRVYAKKITTPGAGIILSADVYCQMIGTSIISIRFAIYEDNAGTPDHLMFVNAPDEQSVIVAEATGPTSDPRWHGGGLGMYVPAAGDYWIAFAYKGTATQLRIFYDGSGADRYITPASSYFTDWAYPANATTLTDRFSFRASFLAL